MKFLLIDDHVLIREALRGVLKELRRDATVLEAATCRQAEQLVEEHGDLEVILLDLNLPDGDGFRMLAQWREHHPEISIVVLSASSDRDNVVRALDLGAVGFIPKSAQRAVMIGALELVLSGGIYIPPEILVRGALALSNSAAKEVANRPAASLARRLRADRAAGRGARADDAGEEQQGDRSRPRAGRAHGEEPCRRNPEGAEGEKPHRGRDGRGRAWVGFEAGRKIGMDIGGYRTASAWSWSCCFKNWPSTARNARGRTGLCNRW